MSLLISKNEALKLIKYLPVGRQMSQSRIIVQVFGEHRFFLKFPSISGQEKICSGKYEMLKSHAKNKYWFGHLIFRWLIYF